jgi:hypothetical protein
LADEREMRDRSTSGSANFMRQLTVVASKVGS